jgi:hypothetical protein
MQLPLRRLLLAALCGAAACAVGSAANAGGGEGGYSYDGDASARGGEEWSHQQDYLSWPHHETREDSERRSHECGCARARSWTRERAPVVETAEVIDQLPATFFIGDGGVGPGIVDYGGSGGGFVFTEAGAEASASAFASASASAHVRAMISVMNRPKMHAPPPMKKSYGHW